jgi:hypothetical protein
MKYFNRPNQMVNIFNNMNLNEQISRMKSMMGLLIESTDKLSSMNDDTVLVSDYVKSHIKDHNKFGTGSTFREGISDEEIIGFVNQVIGNQELGDGGAFEIDAPEIGFDLVLPYEEAINLNNAEESVTIKKEGPNEIEVPLVRTSQSSGDFKTNRLTLIIRKSNPQFLPDDVKEDEELLNKLNDGKVYSLLTAFPGNPNIPRASEWNGQYAVVVPKKEEKMDIQ